MHLIIHNKIYNVVYINIYICSVLIININTTYLIKLTNLQLMAMEKRMLQIVII